MRFSIWPDVGRPWPEVVDLVQHCEQTGWDGAYVADHFMPNSATNRPEDGPVLESWAVLAALAALTRRLRLGTLVSANTYRHPAVVAKAATTIDQISDGRFVLGLGAGWQVNEHEAYGIELPGVPDRLDRLEEACAVVTSLLRQPRSDFAGEHYRLTSAPCQPEPIQHPLPLLVGGGGEQRTMRIAARFADEWNAWCTPEMFHHKTAVLDRRCAEVDRDPVTIKRSTQAFVLMSDDLSWLASRRARPSDRPQMIGTPAEVVEVVGRYRAAGVDELIIPDWNMGPPARRQDTCDRFITDVASIFRPH